ncbi:MAG: hypothetical protein ACRDZ4_10010 [Egibacteraceae bacterium]
MRSAPAAAPDSQVAGATALVARYTSALTVLLFAVVPRSLDVAMA